MKNERGFTLIEMVISLGVIAIIGSLLVSSIVTINANTKTADLMSFLDSFTTQAREVFASNPDKVFNGNFDPSDPAFFPYNNEDMNFFPATAPDPNAHYRQSFTENLQNTGFGDPNEHYRIEITFVPSDEPNSAPGFDFHTKKIEMKAKVSEKVNGVMKAEPLYSREYTFNNVVAGTNPVTKFHKVTFNGNNGCIVNSTDPTSCLPSNSITKDYADGSSLVGPGADGSSYRGYLANSTFIGWSLGASDRNLLGGNYRVTQDISVFAQYLAQNQYRLEFQINGNQRFDSKVTGLQGNDATKPYYVEKTFATEPKVKDMENNISRFWSPYAVRQNGYKLKGWADEHGTPVTIDSLISNSDRYMVLHPVMEEIPSGDLEEIPLHFTLNLNNVVAGTNGSGTRMFALYPFTRMEYNLTYKPSDDSFDITQKEIMNDDEKLLTGVNKGTVMSTKTFNTKNDENFYLDYQGQKYKTFTEFVKGRLDDPKHVFSISNTQLEVNIPTFDLKDYYTASGAKDSLQTSSGVTLNQSTANTLFADPSNRANFGFSNSGNVPMDANSVNAINNKIADLTYGIGTFTNTGGIDPMQSTTHSYSNYVDVIPGREKDFTDKHLQVYDVYISIPLSILGKMNPGSTKPGMPDLEALHGVHVSNIQVYYDDIYDGTKSIHIRYDLKFGNGKSAVKSIDGTDSPTIDINTGIPAVEWQNQQDKKGNELYTFNKLQTIHFTIDGWDGAAIVDGKHGSGKSSLSDLTLDTSQVIYTYMDPITKTVSGKGIQLKPTDSMGETGSNWAHTGWWPLAALYKGPQDSNGNWLYSDMSADPNFDSTYDQWSTADIKNTNDQKARAVSPQWNNDRSPLGLYDFYEANQRPCGHAGWGIIGGAGADIFWNGPRQIKEQCLLSNGIEIPDNPGNHTNFSKKLVAHKYFDIKVNQPEQEVDVLSFSPTGATQNYLPSFITNVRYTG